MSTAKDPRLPMLQREGLADDARDLYDEIARTRNGMPTSFRVFLNSPGATRAIADLGTYVRFEAGLLPQVLETAVMRVAALHDDDYMWAHHLELAREAGLDDTDLDRLRDRDGPPLDDPEGRELVAFVDAQVSGSMSDQVFAAVLARLGAPDTIELTLEIAYYALIHSLFSVLGIEGPHDTRTEAPADARSRPGPTTSTKEIA